MADAKLAQRLRKEMRAKFNIKSNGKKRKLPSEWDRDNATSKHGESRSKASMIKELKELGLVQGSKRSLPQRNHDWKEQKKKQNNHRKHASDGNKGNVQRPTKRRKMNNNNHDEGKLIANDDTNIQKLHKVW